MLCSNGDVLKLKKPKILKYIIGDEESMQYKYSKVILFRLLNNFDNLNDDLINHLFYETSREGSLQNDAEKINLGSKCKKMANFHLFSHLRANTKFSITESPGS